MSYETELAAISRTPVNLIIMTLDFCSNTFGNAPCIATGTKCFNTFPTCKDKTHFTKTTKDYEFTSIDAPLPFKAGERPYLKTISYLPTEIKDNQTVNARVTAEFADEPDTDIGIDPYVASRPLFPNIPGTFWKKFLTRNRNYKGRLFKHYDGFIGLAKADFRQRFIGVIENITSDKDGDVKIEVVDLLKSLANIEIPPKLDIKLVADIDNAVTTITLTTVVGLDAPGYVRIGDEIIYYTTKNETTNQISGCTRGYFSTTAIEHKAKDKIQKTKYFAPASGFDHAKSILIDDAGIDAAYIDTAAFTAERDWPAGEVNFSAIISEPVKADKLYFGLMDLIDCKSWIAEDIKITLKRNLPNEPERPYLTLTDAENVIEKSPSLDLNQKSRFTRISMYWDKKTLGKAEEPADYSRLDIAIDADAEGPNEYDDVVEKKIWNIWLRDDYLVEETVNQFVVNFLTRYLFRYHHANEIITLDVELKDSDNFKTGRFLRFTTDELLNADGTNITEKFQIIKREPKGAKLTLKLLKVPQENWAFIAPNDAPDFDSATDADKEYAFITNETGLINDRPGYYIWG